MYLHLIVLGAIAKSVFGANILFITAVASPSHHIWNEVLVGGVLQKGHNVTLIGHSDPIIRAENYTVLKIEGVEKVYEEMNFNDVIQSKDSAFQDLLVLWDYIVSFAKLDLNSNALKVLLDYPKDMFDLIVFDVVAGQCFYPLIEHFGNPPVIAVSPFSLPPYVLDTMGSHFYSYYPIIVLPYTDRMTFWQRIENMVLYMTDYYIKWQSLADIYKMSQERFGENITPFDKVEKQIGLLLTNYDPLFDFPLSLPPNIIPVGGLHIKRPTTLSDDIKKILDESSDGVIYFSFGTNVDPSLFPPEKKKMFLDTFAKLKHTILWKYNGDDLKNVPKNVVIRKWYPQSNILGHKNVKLFLTHSGGLSTQEAIYYSVPMVSIPFFVDQKNNAQKMEGKTLGKMVEMRTLNVDILYEAIQEVLNNPIYKQNMQKISGEFRDQKETPLERAVFWVEYVLKHKDLRHLSIRARDMSLLQRENLDVYGFFLICAFVLVILIYVALKLIVKLLFVRKNVKIKRS